MASCEDLLRFREATLGELSSVEYDIAGLENERAALVAQLDMGNAMETWEAITRLDEQLQPLYGHRDKLITQLNDYDRQLSDQKCADGEDDGDGDGGTGGGSGKGGGGGGFDGCSLPHKSARETFDRAFRELGVTNSLARRQAAQVVALAETQYGAGWSGAGKGSNNWGAVQAGKPPCDDESTFLYTDSHPNEDGSSTRYEICFRRYRSPLDGAKDVVRILDRMGVFEKVDEDPSIRTLSQAMYDAGYYEGFGATEADRVDNHVAYLTRWFDGMNGCLGEPAAIEGEDGGYLDNIPWKPIAIGAGVVAGLGGLYLATRKRAA